MATLSNIVGVSCSRQLFCCAGSGALDRNELAQVVKDFYKVTQGGGERLSSAIHVGCPTIEEKGFLVWEHSAAVRSRIYSS